MSNLIRQFDTGATRNSDVGKPDYEGFLSPIVLLEFARYMNIHRVQADGNVRPSDNWQKGIPKDAYMKSLWRHFHDLWMLHRGYHPADKDTGKPITLPEALSAVLFNVQGYFLEVLKEMHPEEPAVVPQADQIAREYTKGHAEETAARFNLGLPYDDGSQLQVVNGSIVVRVGEPNASGEYAVQYRPEFPRLVEEEGEAKDDFSDLRLKPDPNAEPPQHPKLDPNAPETFGGMTYEQWTEAAKGFTPPAPWPGREPNPVPEGKGDNYDSDPVFQQDGLWFFWDETWSNRMGAFHTEEEARTVLLAYVVSLDQDARDYEAEEEAVMPTSQEIKDEVDDRAAQFIRDNPFFDVNILDGEDGVEACAIGGCNITVYPAEENPIDLAHYCILAKPEAEDERRWLVSQRKVWFSESGDVESYRLSAGMDVELARMQLAAGYLRVVEAGSATPAELSHLILSNEGSE